MSIPYSSLDMSAIVDNVGMELNPMITTCLAICDLALPAQPLKVYKYDYRHHCEKQEEIEGSFRQSVMDQDKIIEDRMEKRCDDDAKGNKMMPMG